MVNRGSQTDTEEFSFNLTELSTDPILIINPDTSVRHVNKAFERLTGYRKSEVLGTKAPYPWWLKEKTKKILEDYKNIMIDGAERIEQCHCKKNDDRFWVELTSTPLKRDGRLVYTHIRWVDITYAKQAQEEQRILLEAKQTLRSVKNQTEKLSHLQARLRRLKKCR